MSTEQEHTSESASEAASADLERGTYEIIRDRLLDQGGQLRQQAEKLNQERLELFGGTELTVVGNERIRTENNCLPRDIVSVGGLLLFGYNVFLGLRSEIEVEDVFSLHRFAETEDGFTFKALPKGASKGAPERAFLEDPRFVAEFKELYKFYKSTRLLQLRRPEGKLLAVFQTGPTLADLKVFRWLVDADGEVEYLDNRGERDHVFAPSHDFEWTITGREHHVSGRHPHVNILDEVFVETVGGDLTVKVEDNTEDGLGIYREPVDDANQSLDDAEVHYAKVGILILMKVLPYREETWRYLVFNTRTQQVDRLDAIGQACVQLPEDHGLIFPGGYYLQSGATKTFPADIDQLEFVRSIRSPNGEDVFYVFHHRAQGRTILLPYNLIRKEVQNPIECNGYSLFADGRMVIFRSQSEEPTRVHPMQVWQTPFVSDEHAAAAPTTGSYLEKIGNADLVRGISDLLSLARRIDEQTGREAGGRRAYEDLILAAGRVLDSYYWLDHKSVRELSGPLAGTVQEIRETGELIIDEYEKVESIRAQAVESVQAAEKDLRQLILSLRPDSWTRVDAFVEALGKLRRQRGRLVTLRELRYVDLGRLDELEAQTVEHFDRLTERTVGFLDGDEALAPYHQRIDELDEKIEAVEKVTESEPLRQAIDALSDDLDLLADVVSGLAIDDATVRTRILEGISEVLGRLNRTRAVLEARRRELLQHEGVAEFGAQFKLFGQSVTSALNRVDSPERCDDELSQLMLQLEDLESRFSEFDDFLEQLATKREDVYEAFNTKKQQLLDARKRRADHLMQAAERILQGVGRRTAAFKDVDDLNTYFASDPMVTRLRDLVTRLREAHDNVRADELESRLKASKQDAARSLRDRQEIFEEGADVIKLGRHRFSVNTQLLDLTLLVRDDEMNVHLTGTDFYEPLRDDDFAATQPYWQQHLVSETDSVYRGEYLAACMLASAEEEQDGLSVETLTQATLEDGKLLELVREFASERYDEGYERGLHDHDTARILERLLTLYNSAGLLRFAPKPRAAAVLFWVYFPDQTRRALWQRRARSLARLRATFAHSPAIFRFTNELAEQIAAFYAGLDLDLDLEDARAAGSYLFEELGQDPLRFVVSAEAVQLRDAFLDFLEAAGSRRDFDQDLRELADDLGNRTRLAQAWLAAFCDQHARDPKAGANPNADAEKIAQLRPALEGAVALLLTEDRLDRDVSSALGTAVVEELLGRHGRIENRRMQLRLDEFLARLGAFRHRRVPGYRRYQELRHEVLERERDRLRLDEFRPRVMSAFVRNQLLDQVYLPLIGDNLAKQIGALGEGKRTDQMGLLLLISPPGYGKTTLMEYVAHRLGLVFLKVNGPSLGHRVTSLDPAEAPNATARQEVEKINLAFEMANNVLLYLDDIQHTDSELLQKFISLCDAQRRVEGVWNGRTRTYDLRGKRFAVCMAGNPYTESGETFRIPDMLANRADVYNLGDILEGKGNLFALSYIENALTSNPVLAPLTTRDAGDVDKLVRMARGEALQADQLGHGYSAAELNEILSVLRKLITVQEVLLQVNQQYIHSAAQDDAFRTEPRFQLQGSYRNMNRLAEKVVPVMNDAELQALIDDHYVGEAQTLTTGAEHNLLKLAELRGRMSDEQKKRWQEIKRSYARVQAMGGDDEDPVARVVGQLGLMADRLGDLGAGIRDAAASSLAAATATDGDAASLTSALKPYLEGLQSALSTLAQARSSAQESPTATAASEPAAQQITQHVSQLAGRLEQIGEAIARAAEAVVTRPVPAASAEAAGRAAAAIPAAAGPDLTPYLDRLGEALSTLAESPKARHIVQTLPAGVHGLMEQMVDSIEETFLPAVRALDRQRRELGESDAGKQLGHYLDRTLKSLDQLKDLVTALTKIEVAVQ